MLFDHVSPVAGQCGHLASHPRATSMLLSQRETNDFGFHLVNPPCCTWDALKLESLTIVWFYASTQTSGSSFSQCRSATGERPIRATARGETDPLALGFPWPNSPRGPALFQHQIRCFGCMSMSPTFQVWPVQINVDKSC